ncbi:MAG TPA: sensor histidine kinase [Streptosporangiaceae bacterium]|nr:sensor histidine kinase [Streptosporangiaceae bacterium]
MDDPQVPFVEPSPARQWALVDVVAAVLTGVAWWAAATKVGGPSMPAGYGWTVVRYLAGGAACASLMFRWRFPVAVLGVAAGSAALFDALAGRIDVDNRGGVLALIPVALAVYTVVATSTRRAALAAVATAVAAIEAGALARGGSNGSIAQLTPALAAVAWLAAENVRARRAYVQGVIDRAAERERERARRASAGERVRIARELHDVVAHATSIIAVRSGVARMALDVRPDEARQALEIIEGTSRQALREMRLLVGVLRDADAGGLPADLGPAPGLASLPELVAHVNEAGVPVGVRVEGEPRPLSPGADLSAYRIVQEALTNVVRHAAPASAELTLRYRPCEVVIEVTDNGRTRLEAPLPARAGEGAGHGIAGMRERAAVYGGTLVAEPTAAGFRVLASIPTEEAAS